MSVHNNKIYRYIIVLAILLFAVTCNSAETNSTEAPSFAPMGRTSDAKSMQLTEAMVSPENDYVSSGGSVSTIDSEQMVIKRASLEIIVRDVQGTIKRIEDAAALLQGIVVSSNSSDNEISGVSGNMQIRVPSEHLTTLLDAIKFDSVRVPHESVNSSDVTEEYIDLVARLENLELTETASVVPITCPVTLNGPQTISHLSIL